MHTTAFIITNVTLSDGQQPTNDMLREAARQAITFSKAAQTEPEGTDFESFALGSRRHKYIQGNSATNRQFLPTSEELDSAIERLRLLSQTTLPSEVRDQQFSHLPEHEWPELTHEVMSQIREPDLSPEAINAIPLEVLRNSWNSGRNLVKLALSNRPTQGQRMEDALIFPELLLDESGILGECVTFPDYDVFGDSTQRLIKEGKVLEYLESDPGSAFFTAQQPLRRLAKAKFHCKYIRIMAQHNDRLVLESDWNMQR